MEPTQAWSRANTEYCTHCGAVLQPDQAFCIQCGAPVAPQPQQTVPPTAFCTNCGKPLEPGAAVCIHCGQVIDNPLPRNESYTPANIPATPLTMVTPMLCTNCGQPVEPGNAFCIHCGAEVKSPMLEPKPADVVLCPKCRRPVEPGNAFCIHCGAIMENSVPETIPANPPDPNWGALDNPPLDEPIPDKYGSPIPKPWEAHVDPPERKPLVPLPPVRPKSLTDEHGNVIDDDPFMVSQLVEITAEEAQSGCRKSVATDDGRTVTIDVPPRSNAGTEVDVPGYGLLDPSTGSRGPLRITFYIVRE